MSLLSLLAHYVEEYEKVSCGWQWLFCFHWSTMSNSEAMYSRGMLQRSDPTGTLYHWCNCDLILQTGLQHADLMHNHTWILLKQRHHQCLTQLV